MAASSIGQSEGVRVSPLTAESVLASIFGVIRARLVSPEQNQMIELLGPLMEILAIPLAASEQLVREERRRGDELARAIREGRRSVDIQPLPWVGVQATPWPSSAVPAMLTNPRASRLRECLLFVADHPEASNREVGAGVGIAHDSQISKLLSELHAEGLLTKRSDGIGKRNLWRLTSQGEDVVRVLAG